MFDAGVGTRVSVLELVLGLQVFQLAILLLHDWVPVPPLNDLHALKQESRTRSLAARLMATVASSVLPLLALGFSLAYLGTGFPH